MTATQILAAGLLHLLTPGPQTGWPHRIQQLLDDRDTAATLEAAAEWGSREHWQARASRVAAECGLARALHVPAREAEPLDDSYLTDLINALTTA
ncbi:hypothetical protein ACFVFS_17520 [Kitasatospora sp. NPDC057692]|uniref:hypothetical protein n=1 Tax=Kitasatospora sp. NPDC057692 TaxID=3346215 RepID=UPI0036833976